MKKLLILTGCLFFMIAANAQDAIKPAETGTVYGTVTETGEAIKVGKLESSIKDNKFEGKIMGQVTEVCQTKGCWIKLKKADGTDLMVKAKDHGFYMPADIVGKMVVVEGSASVKEVSEKMRKHFAEDAGKSKEEIEKIKGTSKEVMFSATGVKVL